MPADQRQPSTDALTVLQRGEVELQGRMPWSSNATFLATVSLDGVEMSAIYKPHRGERPLWDFPDGLYVREVAAYALSEALGWALVPETLMRDDLPLGTGSLQRFVDADFEHHYFTLLEDDATHDALQMMATFDLLANNADRKSGHVLLGHDGHIWGIDHGLCFHREPKLRTVMWDFAGQPLPEQLFPDIQRLLRDMPAALGSLLNGRERDAICRRASAVLRMGVFPDPGEGRPYPWPLV